MKRLILVLLAVNLMVPGQFQSIPGQSNQQQSHAWMSTVSVPEFSTPPTLCTWEVQNAASVSPGKPGRQGITKPEDKSSKKSKNNILTRSERRSGWKLLFDGNTFAGWRGLGRDKVPAGSWVIEDRTIRKVNTPEVNKTPDEQSSEEGDLMTIETFENFELCFEWKIKAGGNTGIKYNVSEEMSRKYGGKYHALGFEYQLLDDGSDRCKGKLTNSQFSGSLYDLLPSKSVVLNPVGEFNSSRILVDSNHAEHWLNGRKVLEYEFGSKELDSAFKLSKFNKIPGFLEKREAPIVL